MLDFLNSMLPVLIPLLTAVVGLLAAWVGLLKNKVSKRYGEALAGLEGDEKLRAYLLERMAVAETTYKVFGDAIGQKVGGMKKENVLKDLQIFAISNGIAYDAAKWSDEIEQMIAFSKTINAARR